jgi:hypothetical protein
LDKGSGARLATTTISSSEVSVESASPHAGRTMTKLKAKHAQSATYAERKVGVFKSRLPDNDDHATTHESRLESQCRGVPGLTTWSPRPSAAILRRH